MREFHFFVSKDNFTALDTSSDSYLQDADSLRGNGFELTGKAVVATDIRSALMEYSRTKLDDIDTEIKHYSKASVVCELFESDL